MLPICRRSKTMTSVSIIPVNTLPCKNRGMVWRTKKKGGRGAVLRASAGKSCFPCTTISHDKRHGWFFNPKLVNKKADSDTILSKKKRFAHRFFIVFLKFI